MLLKNNAKRTCFLSISSGRQPEYRHRSDHDGCRTKRRLSCAESSSVDHRIRVRRRKPYYVRSWWQHTCTSEQTKNPLSQSLRKLSKNEWQSWRRCYYYLSFYRSVYRGSPTRYAPYNEFRVMINYYNEIQ